jgi:hypothetical protein
MGDLVYTKLNEPGYPEVAAVNTGAGVLTKVGSIGGGVGVVVGSSCHYLLLCRGGSLQERL